MGFLDWIVNFFETVWLIIENFIQSLVTLLTVLVQVSYLPTALFAVLPSVIGASMMAVVGIGVAKLLLGWGNS